MCTILIKKKREERGEGGKKRKNRRDLCLASPASFPSLFDRSELHEPPICEDCISYGDLHEDHNSSSEISPRATPEPSSTAALWAPARSVNPRSVKIAAALAWSSSPSSRLKWAPRARLVSPSSSCRAYKGWSGAGLHRGFIWSNFFEIYLEQFFWDLFGAWIKVLLIRFWIAIFLRFFWNLLNLMIIMLVFVINF